MKNDKDFPNDDSLKIGSRGEYIKHETLEQKLEELQDALWALGFFNSELEELMDKYNNKSFSLREEYDKELLKSLLSTKNKKHV